VRTDKDEIARLKAENLVLQARKFSDSSNGIKADQETNRKELENLNKKIDEMSKTIKKLEDLNKSLESEKESICVMMSEETSKLLEARGIIDQIKIDHADEIKKISSDLSSVSNEKNILSEKIECINMLKIRNSELEAQVASLSERALMAEVNNR